MTELAAGAVLTHPPAWLHRLATCEAGEYYTSEGAP